MRPAADAARAERDRRLAAVGRFAAGMLHETRNLLNPVLAAAYLLEMHADDPEQVKQLARRIADLCDVGPRAHSKLRAFLRQEPVQFGDDAIVDLCLLARDVAALAEPLATQRSSGAIQFECSGDGDVYVRGEAAALREAILDLVLRAIAVTPAGGVVRLSVRAEGDQAVVGVQDGGTLNAETDEELFDPYHPSAGAEPGLALAAVYGVAARHGGTTEVADVPDGGTSVRFLLPRVVG